MNICLKHGSDISFEGQDCPVCPIVRSYEDDISQLKGVIAVVRDESAERAAEIARLQAIIDEPLLLAAEKVSNQL